MQIVLVGIGGAVGAIARLLLAGAVQRAMPGVFPFGTFVVNIVGCLGFGLLAGLIAGRVPFGPGARAFLFVGVLGGFTTFSSLGYESFELLRTGRAVQAAANIAGQVVLGILALWGGLVVGRAL